MTTFRFFTGSYTEEDLVPDSQGEGIVSWELDSRTGGLRRLAGYAGLSNPSWVTVDPKGRYLAAASEHVSGASRVCLFEIEAGQRLNLTDSRPTGDASCHVAFTPDGQWIGVAAYMGGGVHFFRRNEGVFAGESQDFRYTGSGPNAARQEAPHAHQVVFSRDGSRAWVPDLGSDRIRIHTLKGGRWEPAEEALVTEPGMGPRHLVSFEERGVAYILGELTGSVQALPLKPGTDGPSAPFSTLPEGWSASPSAAAIRRHPRLPVVYCSHRDGGAISWFPVGPEAVVPNSCPSIRTRDPSPRDFNISPDGRWLVVAGQETGTLCTHSLDPESGAPDPEPAHCVVSGSPVCVAFG